MKELNIEFILMNDYSGKGSTTEEAIEDYKKGKTEFLAYHTEDGKTNLVIANQLQYLFVTDLTIEEVNKQFSTLLKLSINTVFDEVVEITSPYFEVTNDKLVAYVYVNGRFRILILDAANVTNIVMEPYAENANPMELTNPNFIKKTMADLMASTDKAQTHEDLVQGVMARVRYGYNGIVLFGDMFFNNRYQLDSKELVDLFKKALMDIVNPPEENPTEENHVHCRWSYDDPEEEVLQTPQPENEVNNEEDNNPIEYKAEE
jgi:hypothetical protein